MNQRGSRSRLIARKVPRGDERRGQASVPGGSRTDIGSALATETHMKGGITDNGEESQGREEEGRQEAVS